MPAIAVMTPDTAPRDLESLVKAGFLPLQRLAQDLGILNDRQDKAAFLGATIGEKASTVLTFLQAYDTESGGPPKTAVQAAPEPPKKAPKRTPVTSPKAKATAAAAPSTGDTEAIKQSLEIIQGTLQELQGAIYGNETTQGLYVAVKGLTKMVQMSLSASLLLGEAATGQSRQDLLEEAIKDSEAVQRLGESLKKHIEG
jgi:hypothetical protein